MLSRTQLWRFDAGLNPARGVALAVVSGATRGRCRARAPKSRKGRAVIVHSALNCKRGPADPKGDPVQRLEPHPRSNPGAQIVRRDPNQRRGQGESSKMTHVRERQGMWLHRELVLQS